jgi:hypothetical protein
VAGALGKCPGRGQARRDGGGLPLEGDTAGGGRDGGADTARAVPPSQPAPARVLGTAAHQRRWYFRRWWWRRHIQRAVGRATVSSPRSGRARDGE